MLAHLAWMSVLAVGSAGCGPAGAGGSVSIWAASEMIPLTDRSEPLARPIVFDPEGRQVSLFAAGNESVAFQVVLDPAASAKTSATFTFSELVGPAGAVIGPENFAIFRALPVRVTEYPPWYLRLVDRVPEPAMFYDALVPVTPGKTVNGDGRLVMWVDLKVPASARPGTYRGRLSVRAGGSDVTLAIGLEVYGFVLPDARAVAAVGGFDHRMLFGAFLQRDGQPFHPVRMDLDHTLVRRGLAIMRQMMRMAHDHRLDLFETSIHPLLKRDADGNVVLDWREYDAVVLPYVNGTAFDDRIPVAVWPVPFSDAWPPPAVYGGTRSAVYRGTARQVIAGCGAHLRKVVSDPDRMLVWPRRGAVDAGAYARFVALGKLTRGADAQLRILSTLPADPPSATGWTVPADHAKLTDLSAPPGEYFVPPDPAGARRHDVWFSPGRPPYTPSLGVIATAADVRALPWFAERYRCSGLFIPEVLNWQDDPFSAPAGAQTRLFYPGRAVGAGDRVLPSVRLKRLRRGLQDTAYLWLLRQRRRTAEADAISRAMARYAGLTAAPDQYLDPRLDGWVEDPATWALARRVMAEHLQETIVEPHPQGHVAKVHLLNRREFEQKVSTVRVEQIRTHVTADDRGLRAEILLDVYNEHRRDVAVTVSLGSLPPSWQGDRVEAGIAAMAPATRAQLTLSLRAPRRHAGPAGRVDVPVDVKVDGKAVSTVTARAAYMTAATTEGTIRIDGDPGDWPVRAGSTGGQFILIGRRARREPIAKRQTSFQALSDGRTLYLAIRCDEPAMAGITARGDNRVQYTQLMPGGEDLVDVLLDGGTDAMSASDLYHIVVKANGVVITEKGLRCQPPLGPWAPWPAGLRSAVQRGKDAWTVELAIPLKAFGSGPRSRQWRVNVARFATQGAEASSWSGAARHFYDPGSLGTMFIAAPGGQPIETSIP